MILEEVKVLMTQYNGITLTIVFLVHKLRGSVMLVSVAELVLTTKFLACSPSL